MALKAMVETLDGLEEAHKALYKADGERFVLDVEPVEGFVLENVTALKGALAKERERVSIAEERVKAFEGFDPAKAKADAEKVEAMRNWSSDEKVKEQIEQHGKAVAEAKDKLIAEWESKYSTLFKTHQSTAIDKAIVDAAREVNFVSPSIAPKLFGDSVRLQETDGVLRPIVVGADGNEMMTANDDGTPRAVSIKEFVSAQAQSPEYAGLIAASSATGTQGGGTTGNPQPTQQEQAPLHLQRQSIDDQLAVELRKL